MIQIHDDLKPADLAQSIERFWNVSAAKARSLREGWDPKRGTPVFTVNGEYTARGWTEWTQGFVYGSELLQFDATGDEAFLEVARTSTVDHMAGHVTHMGVHDHGFNNVSTYGNLLRFMNEGRIPEQAWERAFYELALKCSGAVQARRWTATHDGGGYIYSFNGPHSLFVDTLRSLRAVGLAHQLGHELMDENDARINLLERLYLHAEATARYNLYYGEGRDAYDVSGRTAHESIFNRNDGRYRCPSSQQGYSPFSTWTRGLAWAMCGYAEQLEFLEALPDADLDSLGGRAKLEGMLMKAARATCDFYLAHTPTDGVPYWDTGAPQLHRLGDYLDRPADPFNEHEPVDSSAAAIAAQGLLRLGRFLTERGEERDGSRYRQAGLVTVKTLLDEPYLSMGPDHQGLLLHSIYHRPNGWDHVPAGRKIPCGEACMWGDYHLREVVLYLQRVLRDEPYLKFFLNQVGGQPAAAAAGSH